MELHADLKPPPPARPTSAISFRNPPPKSLRARRRLGLACCGLCCCCAVLVVATLVLVLVLGVVNPLQEGGLAVEMCALRLCGADGVDNACVAAIEARAAAAGVVDVTLEIGVYNPTIFGADILGLGAAVHVAGALDEDAAPLADGAIAQALVDGGALVGCGHGDAPGYGSLPPQSWGLIEVPCTIALSAPLSAGVSALISNRTAGFELSFSVRAAASGTTFESSRGGSATVWMSMENSTDAMSSLREQWGGGSVTITSSTSNGRIEPGAGGSGGGNATGAAAAAAAALLEWDACTRASEIEELTQMSALLVDLCGASALRELGDVLGDAADCILPGAGGVIDGIIGGIGDIGDAIGGIIGGIGGGGSTASPPPAAPSPPLLPPPPPWAPTCARCNSECGVTPTSIAGLPGSNAAETGLVAAAAGECYQCEYYAGGGASEADGCTYRYSGTLVTYCCEKYACDGCGLIGGGGRRRAEAAAAAAGAAAAEASARAVRGLQLGGDSCANNVQASALSVRVDIAVGNPTMFAFIGRGANVTIHDAEGGLLATGTVPVVPVSLPAQTTTAVAAELSFAPALETLDSGDAVSAALAAVGVTEGGLEQFLTQLLDELTVGLMVDIEVLGWPLQLHRNISTKMSELEAAAGDDDLSADAATALAGLFGGNASECVLCLVGNGGGCLKSTAEFSLALPV